MASLFSKSEWGLGQRPIKTAFSFCKAFSFAPFVPKEKAMWGVEVSLSQEFRVAFLKKSSAKNFLAERFLWVFKKVRLTFISSTPKALFRQQIYTASVGERVDTTNGSLREVAKRRYGSE